MKTLLAITALVTSLGLFVAACDDDGTSNGKQDMQPAAGLDMSQQSPDMAPTCVMNPMTHLEIINACTDAAEYDVPSFFPTLAPDGRLPTLQ
jgi:hypothetical protein